MLGGFGVAQVRAAEELALAGLAPGELMQRAARGLAKVVTVRAVQRDAARVVVLAGPGDNGGDALLAAASVSRRLPVAVVGIGERLHPSGLAAVQEAGVPVHRVDPDAELPQQVRELLLEADLVVDGLLGIGGRPGLAGAMAAAVDLVPASAYLIAVDLPSGLDPAGELPPTRAVFADETVTFAVPKPVHLLPATEPAVGRLTVVDIGVQVEGRPVVQRLGHDDVTALWPVPGASDHKYTRGVLGVVAGSEDFPGAAVLAVTTALEAGVGMVRYVGPRRAQDLVLAACPEVVPGTGQVQAWVLGPGGPDPDLMQDAVDSGLPCVLDAGALDLLNGPRAAPTLLTPHAGELARLLSRLQDREVSREQVAADPLGLARRAATLTGATVLLKGSTTLVVPPGEGATVRSQIDGPAWLATAGAGDVLAGLAGALLAAGLDPADAGALAALVHGVAADRANPGGPVRASAVARALPRAVAHLLAR